MTEATFNLVRKHANIVIIYKDNEYTMQAKLGGERLTWGKLELHSAECNFERDENWIAVGNTIIFDGGWRAFKDKVHIALLRRRGDISLGARWHPEEFASDVLAEFESEGRRWPTLEPISNLDRDDVRAALGSVAAEIIESEKSTLFRMCTDHVLRTGKRIPVSAEGYRKIYDAVMPHYDWDQTINKSTAHNHLDSVARRMEQTFERTP